MQAQSYTSTVVALGPSIGAGNGLYPAINDLGQVAYTRFSPEGWQGIARDEQGHLVVLDPREIRAFRDGSLSDHAQ